MMIKLGFIILLAIFNCFVENVLAEQFAKPNFVPGAFIAPEDLIQGSKSFVNQNFNNNEVLSSLPENFDIWEKWPQCSKTFKTLMNQGPYCGSCYGIATATAIRDKRCIQSNGTITDEISAWDIVSCCKTCYIDPKDGCKGGYPKRVYQYFDSIGIVSGGDYKSQIGCKPYPLAPNDRNWNTSCQKKCQPYFKNGSYEKDRKKGDAFSQYNATNNPSVINIVKQEIMENGPVTAVFDIYMDWFDYKRGDIYSHKYGNYYGGHVVRVIGWGIENGIKFWKAANSLGPEWGDDGFFRIKQETNGVGFEEYIHAGRVIV